MIYGRRASFLFSLLLICFTGLGQSTVRLSGKVLADDFGPLGNAAVYVSRFTMGVFTDSLGNFVLQLPAGPVEVSFSYIGYKSEKLSLNLSRDTVIEVKMKTDLQLKEVVVVDKQKLKAADHNNDGVITLRRENFLSLPPLLGENDPIRAVEMQPGVQSGNEGATGIFVNGGSPDQNLILLDGAPVFNPAHIYGFISVFNGDAIDRIDIYKDAYPAMFGGRLSSVMDVTGAEGSGNKLTGDFTIGLVTSRLHLDGPLDKSHKTIISASLRGSFIGAFTYPISGYEYKKVDNISGGVSYYFEDVNLKLTHQFSDKDKLQWSFFENNDFYNLLQHNPISSSSYSGYYQIFSKVDWSNYVSSLAWTHHFSEKWQWKNSLSFSDYIFQPFQSNGPDKTYTSTPSEQSFSYSGYAGLSYIRQYTFASEAGYTPNAVQQLKLGGGCDGQQFLTGGGNSSLNSGTTTITGATSATTATTTVQPLNSESISPFETFAYVQDEIRPSEHWLINCGFRLQDYYVENHNYFSLLPRVNVVLTPVRNFSVRAAVSGLTQDLHLLTPSNTDVLNEYWVPATPIAPPESGWNYSLGVIQKLPLNFEWSVDGFYRTMKNLIDYQDGADYSFRTSNWEQQIATGGTGKAYGLETYVARSFGRVTGSVAYTLAWSDRKFSTLNNGNWYPYTYDRRHDIAAQLNFLVNKHIELGAAWVYGSGNMVTLPIQNYNTWGGANAVQQNVLGGYTAPEYQEQISGSTPRNSYRLPSYQHLDLSFTYKWKKKQLEHLFNFSIYNVYNHFNVFEVYSLPETGPNGATTQKYQELGLFPILPSLSYSLKFGV